MVLPSNRLAIEIGEHNAPAAVVLLPSVFGPSCFLITLTPLLRLLGHRPDCYLTVPSIAIALVTASGVFLAWINRTAAERWREREAPVPSVVPGAVQAREDHLNKAILPDRVTDNIHKDAISSQAFRVADENCLYLAPDAEDSWDPEGRPKFPQSVVMELAALRQAFLNHLAVIYSLAVDHLRNTRRNTGDGC